MLIIWRADFDGNEKQLELVDRKMRELTKKVGGEVEGPFLPQDASLLYLFRGTMEQLNRQGREFLPWLQKEGIPLTPLRFEVASTPQEFWGK